MIITVQREVLTTESTIGQLDFGTLSMFTLEDTVRGHKVHGKTCIPSGEYPVQLRTEGGMNERYKKKFGNWHKGMLWIREIPNFEYVYFHIGNSPDDTEGCILVGKTASTDWVGESMAAYRLLYPKVLEQLNAGIEVRVDIKDNS